jgi:hypothetical protein
MIVRPDVPFTTMQRPSGEKSIFEGLAMGWTANAGFPVLMSSIVTSRPPINATRLPSGAKANSYTVLRLIASESVEAMAASHA